MVGRVLLATLTSFSFLLTEKSYAQVATCQTTKKGVEACLHVEMPVLSQMDSTRGCEVTNDDPSKPKCRRQIMDKGSWWYVFNNNAHGFWPSKYTMGLREHVNQTYGKDFKEDQGWCGGVAAAMVLKTFARERRLEGDPRTDFPFLGNVNEFITWSFERVGTKPSGGTDTSRAYRGLKETIKGYGYETEIPEAKDYRTGNMPLAYMSIGPSSGHVVALNGREGEFHKIYDAWGSIYTVKIETQDYGTFKSQQLVHASGQHGYVHTKGGRVNLKSYFAFLPY